MRHSTLTPQSGLHIEGIGMIGLPRTSSPRLSVSKPLPCEWCPDVQAALAGTKPYEMGNPTLTVPPAEGTEAETGSTPEASTSRAQAGPVVAGVKQEVEVSYAVLRRQDSPSTVTDTKCLGCSPFNS
jgi:hypothetical protein